MLINDPKKVEQFFYKQFLSMSDTAVKNLAALFGVSSSPDGKDMVSSGKSGKTNKCQSRNLK
jgi:hypothetical protein